VIAPSRPQWEQTLQPIVDALGNRQGRPCLTGVHGSTTAFALTLLSRGQMPDARSWLIVTDSDEAAERLFDDLQFFTAMLGLPAEPLAFFPEWETLPYEATPPHVELIARRMRTLHRLSERARTILITSVPALLQRLLPLPVFSQACLTLTAGTTIERDTLASGLLRLGYRRVSVVEIPGEFSIRGGIVDIYSTAYADPLRVEFLGDTVESVRLFDPATQKSTGKLERAWLLPARELIYPPERPEGLQALPPDAEWRGPDVYASMATLLDYFHEPPVVVLDRPESLRSKAAEFRDEAAEAYVRHGEGTADAEAGPYPTPDRLYRSWDEVLARLQPSSCLATDPLAAPDPSWHPVVPFPIQSPGSAGLAQRGTPFTETLARLDRLRGEGTVLLVARSRGQVERLLALFAEHDLSAAKWTPANWGSIAEARPSTGSQRSAGPRSKPPFYLLQGTLSAGFVSAEGRLSVITEEELFAKGMRHRPPAKSKTATFLSSLEDLNAGDYVVHVQHGIGRYRGLRRLSVQGFESDYLVLEFTGGDVLYVPLDRLNQVQRYRGADQPRMDRLGGTSWARTTARVKQGVEEMAEELVELYASREVVRRNEYDSDSTLTHEFEAAFEYEETPDQLRAIEDIKRDLESPKPMDRLVCGDVGYGKTEVAMRAAFKAVENNRQVAVLVPTTLLGQQHYDNFSLRFAPFPARVAMLSRFQTPKEIKAILKDLAAGTVDVVIGTHRLLQQDVQFRSLGLVIIDEEQWFGVRHKERLKQLRTQVDVLTLTATPIPRTLQMAMSSVRDLSVIETPPPGRLAIRSQVLRFNETVIREAIVRELGRGGQTFFVHNRVQTMERMAARLKELVPEACILMAHGQMDERLLESVMLKFVRREADVLVATAIIQSGLDLPTANTILVNRADTFGLAQLYQLRGRVGRAGHQAYAYFLVPDEGALTGDAQKRLVAIQEFTELGSGFRVAAADLEIRGAGNLLGKQQSGHIAAVGLDLYMQMVEQAVQHLKGTVVEEEQDPTLHLNVSAFIPEDYVGDAHQRLSLYKRLASSLQVGDLALLHGEIQDRYGPLPDPVERLFEVMQIRVLAKTLRLAAIEAKPGTAVIAFDPKAQVPEAGVRRLMDRYQRRLRLLTPLSFELQMPHGEWPILFPELSTALQTLTVCDT
jgi:transcription-repair coupling factor (superfamily II helicase)